MTNNDSILKIYLKEINKIPLLTPEEEKELAVKAKNGDKAAKDKIINSNLRFVIQVAKKYQNQGIDLVDLISEGNVGLIHAINHFDVNYSEPSHYKIGLEHKIDVNGFMSVVDKKEPCAMLATKPVNKSTYEAYAEKFSTVFSSAI